VILRAATEADIPAVAAIAAASYRATFAGILEPEMLTALDAAYFTPRLRAAVESITVATDHGIIVAFAKVTAAHLDMLFAAPEQVGRGAGRALLAAVEAAGVRTLECFRDNKAARSFYERHGWQLARAYNREFAGRMRSFVFYEKP
jgi:putative acetyltransferase